MQPGTIGTAQADEGQMDERQLLTVEQVADYLQTHPETVRRWLREGELKGFNLGGRSGWRIRREELLRFIEKREHPQ